MGSFATEKQYLLDNLGMMLNAGIALPAIMDTLTSETRSSRMRRITLEMKRQVEDGTPLWKALSAARLFPPYIISLIRIGEESGRLPANMGVVAIEQEKQRLFRSQLRTALMYPLFVLVMTVVVGTGTAWFILPKLAVTFSQLSIDLPPTTKLLIGAGLALQAHGLIIVPSLLLGLALAVYLLFFAPPTRTAGQVLLRRVPGVGRLMREVELARMGFLLGTLFEAGMTATTALSSLARASETKRFRQLYEHMESSVAEGNSLKKSFELYPASRAIIPPHLQQLIAAAEQSGKLAETFSHIGASYEAKANLTSKNLSSLIEPFLLVVVWAGVLFVAVSVMLPVYQLTGSLQR